MQERSSSQTSYLDQAIAKTGIQVYTYTLAQKILFDKNKTANQVMLETAGTTYYLNTTKEIVLSAGTFQSPQLLMVILSVGGRSSSFRFAALMEGRRADD